MKIVILIVPLTGVAQFSAMAFRKAKQNDRLLAQRSPL
jgi:hypothetical protein